MTRKPVVVAVAILAASSLIVTTAGAASQLTATAVALNGGANCEDASLDLSMVSGGVDREYGLATNAAGLILDEFEFESEALDDLNGVFVDYDIDLDPDQPDGTIVGSYAYAGSTPPQTATTAEFFVLYVCDVAGANEVLFTCYGDYGTCPSSANEVLAAAVSTTTPSPGDMVTVAVAGCFVPVGGVASLSLLRNGSLIASTDPITPSRDGTFATDIVVPGDVPPNTELELSVMCGDATTGLTRVLPLTVTDATGRVPPPPLLPVGVPPIGLPPGSSTVPLFTG